MTYLHNDPKAFVDDALAGFVAAYPSRVLRVVGGVVRATASKAGEVAIVIGGGSGHYPAFAGLVGPGLAHGAALGNVFASPSAEHVYQVARAAENGGGVLLAYGNYAGDVLNFDQAEARLRADGIPCRTITVSDDISSAGVDEWRRRRGTAGDLCVFKAAAYAAESGASLDNVWAFANRANERTRTLGVAFTGCTLPGASEPLFTIPVGRMGVGVGLHGEPGLREEPIGSADEIARLLVKALLAEVPESIESSEDRRVAVLTNGLGSVKYEELFVLHASVDRLLREAALTVVEPDVGEICTSFEMAGVSLTLFWLDDGFEQAWLASADSPAYRKGSVAPRERRNDVDVAKPTAVADVASAESRAAAAVVARAVRAAASQIDAKVEHLGHLDSIAGDGDHGIGMQRGASAARDAGNEALAEGAGAGTVLTRAAEAWAVAAGGASGALWGLILRTFGERFGDQVAPTGLVVADAAANAADAVMAIGKAAPGDKTMVDSLVPFAKTLRESVSHGIGLADAWDEATRAAATAADATADMIPRVGRARPHGEKSLGTPDPGAVSLALIVEAITPVLRREKEEEELS